MVSMLRSRDSGILGITFTSVRLNAPPGKRSSLTVAEALRLGVTDANLALGKITPLYCLFMVGEFDLIV